MVAEQIITRVAEAAGAEKAEVEHELRIAMMHMMFSPDPSVKRQWESIPHKGELPSPAEFLAWAVEQVLLR